MWTERIEQRIDEDLADSGHSAPLIRMKDFRGGGLNEELTRRPGTAEIQRASGVAGRLRVRARPGKRCPMQPRDAAAAVTSVNVQREVSLPPAGMFMPCIGLRQANGRRRWPDASGPQRAFFTSIHERGASVTPAIEEHTTACQRTLFVHLVERPDSGGRCNTSIRHV